MFVIPSDANLITHQSDSGVFLLMGGICDLLGMVMLNLLPDILLWVFEQLDWSEEMHLLVEGEVSLEELIIIPQRICG
jgi:hypothetical protein